MCPCEEMRVDIYAILHSVACQTSLDLLSYQLLRVCSVAEATVAA